MITSKTSLGFVLVLVLLHDAVEDASGGLPRVQDGPGGLPCVESVPGGLLSVEGDEFFVAVIDVMSGL